MLNNPLGFVGLYALILIPAIFVLVNLKRIDIAFWLSAVLILFQTFSVGFIEIFALKWYEYMINLLGLSAITIYFQKFYNVNNKIKKTAMAVGIIYCIGILFLSIFNLNLDNYAALILFSLVSFLLLRKIETKKYSIIQLSSFYIISLILLTLNLNCNIKFIYDMGMVNWDIENLLLRCNSFYLWILGGMIINTTIFIELRKNYVA